jgi:hypothetical protein
MEIKGNGRCADEVWSWGEDLGIDVPTSQDQIRYDPWIDFRDLQKAMVFGLGFLRGSCKLPSSFL